MKMPNSWISHVSVTFSVWNITSYSYWINLQQIPVVNIVMNIDKHILVDVYVWFKRTPSFEAFETLTSLTQ